MKITGDVAKTIVNEISNTIHKNVNLMDETGKIIASTAFDRVGTYHRGALKIVKEKLDCLTIYTDYEYSGSKMGINMPIYFQGEIAGVIGISGEWDQVSQYIRLIRKATELLLMESYLKNRELHDEASRREYIYKLLFEDMDRLSEQFYQYGFSVGIDANLGRSCFVLSFKEKGIGERPRQIYEYLDAAEKKAHECQISNGQILIYRELTQLSVFVPENAPGESDMAGKTETKTEAKLSAFPLARELAGKIPLPEGVELRVGLDETVYMGPDIRNGYAKACKSLFTAMASETVWLVCYRKLTLGLFADEVQRNTKEEYVKRIFAFLPDEEIEKWIHLLEVFYRQEGSITETANELFVHKNTLQYQLKKLASITGYDPRSLSNAGLYQTAIQFYHSL